MKKEVFNNLYNPDWNSFFSMVEHIGPELNDRKNRFDKADLIEAALEKATNGRLSWVDDIGFDNHDKERDINLPCRDFGFVPVLLQRGLHLLRQLPRTKERQYSPLSSQQKYQ